VTSTSGTNRYSRIELWPVLISLVMAIPVEIGTVATTMVVLSRAIVTGKTRF
jgi:hypothetical protein